MTGRDESALMAALQPFRRWVLAQAERTSLEHADIFALLRKAEANSPPTAKFLMEGLEVLENAQPAEKAEILRSIRIPGKPGRKPGLGKVGRDRAPIVAEMFRCIRAGEKQADVINRLAPTLPEFTDIKSAKAYLRDQCRTHLKRA